MKIWIGGRQCRFQEAVRLCASVSEISRSQASVGNSELGLQSPIPMQKKSGSEFLVEYLLEAQQSLLVVSPVNFEVSFGDSRDRFRLPPKKTGFVIRDRLAELPGSLIIE